jgi:hypothetical protein
MKRTVMILVCGKPHSTPVITDKEEVDNKLLDLMLDDPKEKDYYIHLLRENANGNVSIIQAPEVVK